MVIFNLSVVRAQCHYQLKDTVSDEVGYQELFLSPHRGQCCV